MIKAKTQTTWTGKEQFKKLKRTAQRMIHGPFVTIGVHTDAGEYKSGVSVVEVALWTEFGTSGPGDGVPEYAWLRTAITKNKAKIEKMRSHVVKKVQAGEMDVEQALEYMGFNIQMLVQNNIKSNLPPPNAPSTAASKQKRGVPQRTLIDSGLLLRSIGFKVYP